MQTCIRPFTPMPPPERYGLTAPGPCSTTANTQARRTLTLENPSQGPYYGTVESLDDGGTASYNSLLLSAEHRLSRYFMVLASYTWSHCITDPVTTELSGPIYSNPYNRRFDRGNLRRGGCQTKL
jgi:hypothetical protein